MSYVSNSESARGVGHGNWCFGRDGCEANVQAAEDAKAISLVADGVVVGSAIIEKIQKGATESDVSDFISSLSKSVHLN